MRNSIPVAGVRRHLPLLLRRTHIAVAALSKLESSSKTLAQFQQTHAQIVVAGFSRSTITSTRLLKSSPNINTTNLVFSRIADPDVFAHNVAIKAHAQSSHPLRALLVYRDLLLLDLRPNEYTLCFLLESCAPAQAFCEGRQLHCHLFKFGFYSKIFVTTSLNHFYGECNSFNDALQVFDEMPNRSSATWSSMIGACVRHGRGRLGIYFLKEMMVEQSTRSDNLTNAAWVAGICACGEEGDLELGRSVHGVMVRRGLELNVTLGTSLVGMYSKCGRSEVGERVFSMMAEKSVGSWNCLLHGMAINGRAKEAMEMFTEMVETMTQSPNEVTMLVLLQACSHAGLVEQGAELFSKMSQLYKITPSLKHYGCIVDLYCRAGRVEEAAKTVMVDMPMEPDEAIWTGLFSAFCAKQYGRIEGSEVLQEAERAAARIVKMAPEDACGYLLLARLFAVGRRWDDFVNVRRQMIKLRLNKEVGQSFISRGEGFDNK